MGKKSTSTTVKMVITDAKGIHGTDPKTGDRKHYQKGETIEVSHKTAESFKNRLVHPKVAAAQLKAEEAAQEAAAEVSAARVAAKNSPADDADAGDDDKGGGS